MAREITSFRFSKEEKAKLDTLANIEALRIGRDVSRRAVLSSLINKAYEKEREERGGTIE